MTGPFDPDAAERTAADQWSELTDASDAAHRLVLKAAVRMLASELDDTEHAHSADEAQHAREGLALAARELVRATDALPGSQRPVGWDGLPPGHAGTLSLDGRMDAGTLARRAQQALSRLNYPAAVRAVLEYELGGGCSCAAGGSARLERVRRLASEILQAMP